MKNLLTLLLLIAYPFFHSPAQELIVEDETGRVHTEEVIQVDGLSADVLYSRSRQWVAQSYKSAKDVIQMDDKESGKIVLKALQTIQVEGIVTSYVNMWYTMTIQLKDGRYKCEMDDIMYSSDAYPAKIPAYETLKWRYKKNGKPRPLYTSYFDSTQRGCQSTMNSLKAAMMQQTAGDDNDW